MKDIINSFKAHLYERSSNPIIGPFIFYWSIINYKFLLIIFDGDLSISSKFDLIRDIYPQDKYIIWNGFEIYYYTLLGNGLLIPLIITILYLLIFPFISKLIIQGSIWHQNNIKKIYGRKLIDEGEKKRLQEDLFKSEAKYYKQLEETSNIEEKFNNTIKTIIEEKELEIENLQKQLKENEEEFNNVIQSNIIHNSRVTISHKEAEILEYIGKNPQNMTSSIYHSTSLDSIELEHYLDNFIENKLISIKNIIGEEDSYKLTPEGRAILVEYRQENEIPF